MTSIYRSHINTSNKLTQLFVMAVINIFVW